MNDNTGVPLSEEVAGHLITQHLAACGNPGGEIRQCPCGKSYIMVCLGCDCMIAVKGQLDPCDCIAEFVL